MLRNFEYDYSESAPGTISTGQNYWDVGYDHFDRLMFKEARKNFVSSLSIDWRNRRALGYLMASYLPRPLAMVVRR